MMNSIQQAIKGVHLRHIPPTAVPIRNSDVTRAALALVNPTSSFKMLRAQLSEQTGTVNCYTTSSGRSALMIILLTLKRLSNRKEVVLPAYTCPTVAQVVLKAGLVPIVCDVSPKTLDLDREHLKKAANNKPLAIIPTHLYGIPSKVSDLIILGQESGAYIIEDACQAYGARIDGQMVGTHGDFGYYSFGRGKCIPAGGGGVIVTREQYSKAIAETFKRTSSTVTKWDLGAIGGILAYRMATTPFGWWFVARSRANPANDGMNVEALPPVSMDQLSAIKARIAASIMNRNDEIIAARQHAADNLTQLVSGYSFLRFPQISDNVEPAYLRFPIVLDSENRARILQNLLHKAGIGVSKSYSRTVPDLFSKWLDQPPSNFPGAAVLAERLLTLPTNQHFEESDQLKIRQVLDSID